jgi:general nucleoside transport system permease protein
VILFAGALEHMFRPSLQALFASVSPRAVGAEAKQGERA